MTVVVAALIATLVLLAVGGLAVASAAEAARRAAQAADFASLAGAIELRDSGDQARACGAASVIATDNGASVTACSTTGDFVVTVRCSASSRWGVPGVGRIAQRWARAGPDEQG